MNNNQKKLFNIACKIEKVLYSQGMSEFYKTTTYSSIIIICLWKKSIGNSLIQELDTICKKHNNVDVYIFVDNDGNLKIKIW